MKRKEFLDHFFLGVLCVSFTTSASN